MDRNLALEFVRVTEAGAIAAARWFGKGDKNAADGAAVDAMRDRFNSVDFDGEVMIGEGDKDEAPLLYIGEKIGTGKGPQVEIAVDPLECTTNCATGRPNSLTVMAAGPKGSMLRAPGTYMDQIAVGPKGVGCLDITKSLEENLKCIAKNLGKPLDELTVAILDRPRHEERVKKLREMGCRIWLHDHGTIAAAISTALPESPIDVMLGVAGAPEAVISAAGLKCLGGDIQGILMPHDDKTRQEAKAMGIKEGQVFEMDDLAKGNNVMFVASGISEGPILEGVIFRKDYIITHSMVMRSKTGTHRFMKSIHNRKEVKE